MKLEKILMCGALIGTMAFAAGKASAFPLTLKSCSGTISATPSYTDIESTNKAKYITRSFNLKTVMLLVSNTLVQLGSNPPPADVYIAYNPYPSDQTYLTNSSGYYHDLHSGFGGYYLYLRTEDMAASFKIADNGNISENDPFDMFMGFDLLGPDGGEYYAAANYGIGKIKFTENSNKASMTISGGKGADEGTIDSSYDGVSELKFVFSGSAASAEWDGPFWLWWED